MAGKRNTQLDGWRAFAVAGVMWHHWAPKEWRGVLPFEIGLFFFLTLTGFLITRILLAERQSAETTGGGWQTKVYLGFQKRRMLRILVPCYAAMLFALAVGARDIWNHPWWYFGHLSNFHMAMLPRWPSGTAHYWTLAIQMQFYLVWPLLVLWLPRRMLGGAFGLCVLIAPVSRWILEMYHPGVYHGEAISPCALDYFGTGALLALAMERGLKAGNAWLSRAALASLVIYVILRTAENRGAEVPWLHYFQQTFVSVVFVGLISATLAGIPGVAGRVLDHPAVQHVGRLSYGLYLFHTPVPLFLGWVLPQLWWKWFDTGAGLAVRLGVFALVAWGMAWLCWRYLEKGGLSKRAA